MKYNIEFCSRCNKETLHRIFRRYGKAEKGKGKGRKKIKRTVTWCLICQRRRIDKQIRQKKRHISLRK